MFTQQRTKYFLYCSLGFVMSIIVFANIPKLGNAQASSNTLISLLNGLVRRAEQNEYFGIGIHLTEPIFEGEDFIPLGTTSNATTVLSSAEEDYFCVIKNPAGIATRLCASSSSIAMVAYSYISDLSLEDYIEPHQSRNTLENLLWETNQLHLRANSEDVTSVITLRYPAGYQIQLYAPHTGELNTLQNVGDDYFCISRASGGTGYFFLCIADHNLLSITQSAEYFEFPQFPMIIPLEIESTPDAGS